MNSLNRLAYDGLDDVGHKPVEIGFGVGGHALGNIQGEGAKMIVQDLFLEEGRILGILLVTRSLGFGLLEGQVGH
jgi:hypothetical protein